MSDRVVHRHETRRGVRQPPVERLFEEVAAQFAHQPAREAASAIAEHMMLFWDPRMRAELVELLRLRESDQLADAVVRLMMSRDD